jgi:hypothetical protein
MSSGGTRKLRSTTDAQDEQIARCRRASSLWVPRRGSRPRRRVRRGRSCRSCPTTATATSLELYAGRACVCVGKSRFGKLGSLRVRVPERSEELLSSAPNELVLHRGEAGMTLSGSPRASIRAPRPHHGTTLADALYVAPGGGPGRAAHHATDLANCDPSRRPNSAAALGCGSLGAAQLPCPSRMARFQAVRVESSY